MTEMRALPYGVKLPVQFVNRIQDLLSSYISPTFELAQVDPTTIQVEADGDNDTVALTIDGRWRFVTSTLTCAHPGGSAGTYDIWATAADNDFVPSGVPPGSGDPETDLTDYTFALAIKASGYVWGGGDPPLRRKVGTLTWDGSAISGINGVEAEPASAWRQTFDIASASGLRTLFTQSIPSLGPNDELEIVGQARYKNDTGGGHGLRLQIIYGGVTYFDATTDPIAASAHARGCNFHAWLSNEGVTALQRLSGYLRVTDAQTGVAGNGDLQGDDVVNHGLDGHDNVDSTSPKTLTVKIALNASDPNMEIIGSVRVKINRVP